MSYPTHCAAADGEPCDCPACLALERATLASMRPLYDAENRAGIAHPKCLHCGADCRAVICPECGSSTPLRP